MFTSELLCRQRTIGTCWSGGGGANRTLVAQSLQEAGRLRDDECGFDVDALSLSEICVGAG